MKINYIIASLFTLAVSACVKQNGTDTTLGTGTVDTTTALLRYSGMFMNGPYGTVSGAVRIYREGGGFLLKLEGVSISYGPDLHVYLSKEVVPVNYIDLGSLQSTGGNQVYTVPGNPDFSEYRYALIHCQRYNHLFGSAVLQ